MAWRPDKSIIRGEIDNTVRGRVTGKLRLVGREEPVTLELDGDAWADVAGRRLTFSNPHPREDGPGMADFSALQRGRVGDINASNKRRVYTMPEEEWMQAMNEGRLDAVPFVIRNTLYVEWFGPNGRVVIENGLLELISAVVFRRTVTSSG